MELDVYKLDFKNMQNYAEKLSNYAENSIVQYQFSLSRKKFMSRVLDIISEISTVKT